MKTQAYIDCPHTLRVLDKAGVTTMEQLAALSREDLLALRGVGKIISEALLAAVEQWRRDQSQTD